MNNQYGYRDAKVEKLRKALEKKGIGPGAYTGYELYVKKEDILSKEMKQEESKLKYKLPLVGKTLWNKKKEIFDSFDRSEFDREEIYLSKNVKKKIKKALKKMEKGYISKNNEIVSFYRDDKVAPRIVTETETGADVTSDSSTRGPAVNIWAPGTNIVSATSNINSYTNVLDYPGDSNYKITMLTGTSEASPQIVGLCALHLQAQPNLTPDELRTLIISQAKAVVHDEGTDTDYTNYTRALLGSANNIAYSRYGRQPVTINGPTLNMRGISITT